MSVEKYGFDETDEYLVGNLTIEFLPRRGRLHITEIQLERNEACAVVTVSTRSKTDCCAYYVVVVAIGVVLPNRVPLSSPANYRLQPRVSRKNSRMKSQQL